MSKLKTDKLRLLEKLVQSSSDGEITTEQRDLFVNLVKETSPKSPKMRKKSANTSERVSRQRIKVVRNNSHEVEDKNHGKVQIPLPQSENRSRSGSSRSRSDSSSSFWSSGSQDRARMRKTSSRSRSNSRSSKSYSSRSRSRSRSRSSSSSASSSRSRSRSSSAEYSRNKKQERSKSPQMPLSPAKEQYGSVTSTQSAPLTSTINRRVKTTGDTASDSGRGKRKKLLKRSQIKKSRSLDMNPDIFIEERIKQKYKELNKLLSSQFTGSQLQVTQHQYQQMQNLRTQYVSASHGLPPSGILIPRSLPHDLRVKRGAPQGLSQSQRRSRSKDTLTSDFGEDKTYVSVQRVLNTTAAREGKVIVDPHPVSTKKKKVKKTTGSNTKLNSTFDSASENTGSRTLSPRSRLNVPELHHLKDSPNKDLVKWVKQKDKEHRIKQKEERKKRREEREKLVLEANEKFEKRLESHKVVEKWRTKKEKEYRKMMKEKKNEEKEIEMYQKRKMEMSLPGNSIMVRPQTAPPEWKQKQQTNSYKTMKQHVGKDQKNNEMDTGRKALTVQDQLGTSSEHLKFDLNDQNSKDQLPTTSKFMYKRPVAGKIKLNMKNRPMSAQPKLQTSHREQSEQLMREEQKENVRMSYDDWINTKKKKDIEKQKQEKIRQKKQLSKSDPEIDKIVPDIAKKRIHTIMNERKSIDTGIKRYDAAANRSFGGGSFEGGTSPKTSARSHAYKLEERPSTAKGRTTDSLKVAGSSYQRPGTAPPRGPKGPKVPMPMRSPYSPIPAHAPARVEEVMKSEDQSNPFKLPFPPAEGVPKHVAARQRKLFSEEFQSKDESREQQNQDNSMAVVPATSAVVAKTSSTEDIQYDNITAKDISNDVDTYDKNDYQSSENNTVNGDTEVSHHYQKGNDEEINIEEESVQFQKTAENNEDVQNENTGQIAEDLSEKNHQHGESKTYSVEKNKVSETNFSENLVNGHVENSDTKLENQPNNYDEVDTSHAEQKTNGEVDSSHKEETNEEVDEEGSKENVLNHLSKHVSFCEEPEVFVDEISQEWSTDTGTPDEDNSRYTTKEDLSTLIDNCGELLNKEYGDQKEDDNKFVTESLDDDF